MNREFADVTAGKEQWAHDVGIGGERHRRAARFERERRGIVHTVEQRIGEGWREDALDQIMRCLAAAAMAERDAFITQIKLVPPYLPYALDLRQHIRDAGVLGLRMPVTRWL